MVFRNCKFSVSIFGLALLQLLALSDAANGQPIYRKTNELENRALKLDSMPEKITSLNLPNDKQLENETNDIIHRLSKLSPDLIGSVRKSALLQREFNRPSPDPMFVEEPTAEQAEIVRFQEYYIVLHIFLMNKHKEELAKRVEQMLPEDGYISEALRRDINNSLLSETIFYLTETYGTILKTAKSNKVNAFNLEQKNSSHSGRERSLMTSNGVITVPKSYSQPSSEEVKLALVRHVERSGVGRKLAADTFAMAFSMKEVLFATADDPYAGPLTLLIVELDNIDCSCQKTGKCPQNC